MANGSVVEVGEEGVVFFLSMMVVKPLHAQIHHAHNDLRTIDIGLRVSKDFFLPTAFTENVWQRLDYCEMLSTHMYCEHS